MMTIMRLILLWSCCLRELYISVQVACSYPGSWLISERGGPTLSLPKMGAGVRKVYQCSIGSKYCGSSTKNNSLFKVMNAEQESINNYSVGSSIVLETTVGEVCWIDGGSRFKILRISFNNYIFCHAVFKRRW